MNNNYLLREQFLSFRTLFFYYYCSYDQQTKKNSGKNFQHEMGGREGKLCKKLWRESQKLLSKWKIKLFKGIYRNECKLSCGSNFSFFIFFSSTQFCFVLISLPFMKWKFTIYFQKKKKSHVHPENER